MDKLAFRSIVDDVALAIAFYQDLGFELELNPAPGFARLRLDGFPLLLNRAGAGGAGQSVEGVAPAPGGWNRMQVVVSDLAAEVARLKAAGRTFRAELIAGNGGDQALIEDPSGNLVELFQPKGR